MLMDFSRDLLAHTHNLGLFQIVKVFNEDDVTKVQTMDEGKNVMVYGSFNRLLPEFETEVGFGRLSVLSGYTNFSPFVTSDAKVSANMRDIADNKKMLEEIVFESKSGHKASYRLMNSTAIADLNVPKFRGVAWDLSVVPSAQS